MTDTLEAKSGHLNFAGTYVFAFGVAALSHNRLQCGYIVLCMYLWEQFTGPEHFGDFRLGNTAKFDDS